MEMAIFLNQWSTLQIQSLNFEGLCTPWQDALVIKLLGKNIGYKILKEKLVTMWKLEAGFDMLDIDNGYFMLKFDLEEDRSLVMGGGPWMVLDHI